MRTINDELLIRWLRQYNPWWKHGTVALNGLPAYQRSAFFEAKATLLHSLRRFPILSGMRRAGKTTILLQIIRSLLKDGVPPKNILYLPFDMPAFSQRSPVDVLELQMTLARTSPEPMFVFLDEIQYAADWESWLKVLYDLYPALRVAAAASASPVGKGKTGESGVGRWRTLRIPPATFFEFCSMTALAEEAPELPADLGTVTSAQRGYFAEMFAPLQPRFDRYLATGGFPERVTAPEDVSPYSATLLQDDLVGKVLEKDVLKLFGVRDPLLMEKLFLYLCANSAQIMSAGTLAKELGDVSRATIEMYIEALEQSNLVALSYPARVGSKAALKSKTKIYITDSAVRYAALLAGDIFEQPDLLETTVEGLVYMHLRSALSASGMRLGYFRAAGAAQKEIDIVAESPRRMILCEVKYRSDARLAKSDAIVGASSEADPDATKAFVITKRLTDFGPAPGSKGGAPLIQVPAPIFLYECGRRYDEFCRSI